MDRVEKLARKITAKVQRLMTNQIKSKIPELYSQDEVEDPIVYVRYFNAYGTGTWLATEFDGKNEFFGAVNLGYGWELGYFTLRELKSVPAKFNGREMRGIQGVERDTSFRPMPLSRAKKK